MKSPQNNCPDAMLRASRGRVAELESALRDAYLWAYTSGKLSEIDDLLEKAAVPVPGEIVTRNLMIEVWKEGFRKFPGWANPRETSSPNHELALMLHYAAMLPNAAYMCKETVWGWLWTIARAASNLLPEDCDVLPLALEEYIRSTEKHPGMTLECDGHSDETRLFALVEEIGEVAACLTYDNGAETGHGSDLESEAIQVIALALAWATRYLDD